MKYFVLITICSFIFGCANKPKMLYKNVSSDEIQRDNADCQLKAMSIDRADYAYIGTFMEGANIAAKRNEAMRLCLISKGYSETPPSMTANSK